MKLKRFSVIFILMLALGTLFSSLASAEMNGQKNLVALGDSITFGYNLGDNKQASPYAFPYLIGNGQYNVTNLGIPGWTSSQLLYAVKSNLTFNAALKSADVVTLDIGSNDLLQAAGLTNIKTIQAPIQMTPTLQFKLLLAQQKLAFNLQAIIKTIKMQTNAPIIVYNLYNPFGAINDPNNPYYPILNSLHVFGEQVIPTVNRQVIRPIALATGSLYADAYGAFNGNQATYIIPFDIHPTPAGHQALATLADRALLKVNKAPVYQNTYYYEQTISHTH